MLPLNYFETLIDWFSFLPASSATIFYCALVIYLTYRFNRQNKEKLIKSNEHQASSILKTMPSPPSLPVIGHLHLMRDHQENPWDGFNAIKGAYGNVVGLKMGVHSMILVSDLKLMNEILLKKGEIFADRPTFPRHHIIFGGSKENSLALCNWSVAHRDRRKFCKRGIVPSKLSPRYQLLEDIVERKINEFTQTMNGRFKNSSPHTCVATRKDVLFLTGDVFMEFLSNEKPSHSDRSYEEFNSGSDFIFWDINQSYLIDFLPYLTSFGVSYFYLRHLKNVTDYCRDYIEDNIFGPRYKKHLTAQQLRGLNDKQQSNAPEKTEVSKIEQDGNEDYLDSLVKEQISGATTMSLDDYKIGFADLLAGHGAVAHILLRLLGHLALDQTFQDMISDEAKQTKCAKASQLPIAEAALYESLRIASSPLVPHVAREDASIGEYFVKKGSAVLFNIYNLNLSEKLWSKPLEFDPTRFLEKIEGDAGGNKYKLVLPKHYMPFSVGMRQCLGSRMVELISIVAASRICRHFIIKADDESLVRQLLKPKGNLALDPRQRCFQLDLVPRD